MLDSSNRTIEWSLFFYLSFYCNFYKNNCYNWFLCAYRSLVKQIKDKTEHKERLAEDLKKDNEKQVLLEKKIAVC